MNAVQDSYWGGRLIVWQPGRGHGYRFNIDPILLASAIAPADEAIELGAGCGILSLLLLAAGVVRRVTAVEIQPELAELAERNAVANGLADRMRVQCADLRHVQLPPVERVVFNPPYFPQGSGAISPHPGRDAGRREVHGTLGDFVACGARHMTADGSISAIVRRERRDELASWFGHSGLLPCWQRWVHARAHVPPAHVLMTADFNGPLQEAAPLVVHGADGRAFTSEVQAWVSGPPQWRSPEPD